MQIEYYVFSGGCAVAGFLFLLGAARARRSMGGESIMSALALIAFIFALIFYAKS